VTLPKLGIRQINGVFVVYQEVTELGSGLVSQIALGSGKTTVEALTNARQWVSNLSIGLLKLEKKRPKEEKKNA